MTSQHSKNQKTQDDSYSNTDGASRQGLSQRSDRGKSESRDGPAVKVDSRTRTEHHTPSHVPHAPR